MPRMDESRDFCFVQSKILGFAAAPAEPPVTALEYGTLQKAYDHFNGALFAGRLPQVLITLQRHPHARGYFSRNRFQHRDHTQERVHEVALNPDCFSGRTDEEILSTLVHEMAHVWQQEFGHPGRGRYHNREWAALMFDIGLMPSTTAEPGGHMTGDRVSHFILENGAFIRVCRKFLERYRLVWESAGIERSASGSGGKKLRSVEKVASKAPTRSKFTCPICGLNVWAKPDALVDCHKCSHETGEQLIMCAEE